ncbi:MAG: hypothetical protein EWM48_02715 [Sphaerochaeta sp.]|nr:MAG: hypothetical protein EWM48_02715 [Sphaerochaeta sp.]HPB41394.1 hypothetical protein [Sphaerochaeta sp.]HPY46005.1 hypothetical protein [Sphaerochaeta sp.]HQB06155.1 hypothetical protein [Sphaerochaeta sp.]
MTKRQRTLLIRVGAIVLVFLFAVFLFHIGRQHTVLIDNNTVTRDGVELQALKLVEVQVGKKGEVLEMTPRIRDKAVVVGQRHTVKVVYTDASWNEHVHELSFRIPLMQNMVLISLPALMKNPEDVSFWLENFEGLPTAQSDAPQEEDVVFDELAGFDSF